MIFSIGSLRSIAVAAGVSVKQLRSTGRGAEVSWITTRELRQHGTLPVAHGIPLSRLLEGFAFQLLERGLMLINPDLGEELILIAGKPRD
jgi:hypothetical protein